jgi:hypothetical protein
MRFFVRRLAVPGLVLLFGLGAGVAGVPAAESEGAHRFPTVSPEHRHVRLLLENALRYAAPENRMVDPVSGYPFEGWNQDPRRGLFLRSFTQLTAIGQWLELLANVVAGQADTPFLPRELALKQLTHLVESLRQDQHDPRLSTHGLLGNFLDLATGKRLGPLASSIEKRKLTEAFGAARGEAIWKALIAKGWLVSRNQDLEADIQRNERYGYDYFDGPLAPYADEPTRQKILALLDERVVMVVFVDNANLSASVAKALGALQTPGIDHSPALDSVRQSLEQFLDDQQAGYSRLYDPKAGLFYFGWDATRDRLFGWEDLQGKWTTGHVDYLVNEFRAPASFIALRFGTPLDAIRNLGFKIKRYPMSDSHDLYTTAPWEGSAFQALGLGLWLGETKRPGWGKLLNNVVSIEVDYATRHHLPGFLSESYTGEGTQYTGTVGIPEITVVPRPRITVAASLYTLGAAYTVAPDRIEAFLAENWPVVSRLLTDHGPWEGYNTAKQQPIEFQTTAHTLALTLGLLGTGSEQMSRYLDSRGLRARLEDLFPTGESHNLLGSEARVFAWCDKESTLDSERHEATLRARGDRVKFLGIAAVSSRPQGVNLSGMRLRIGYASHRAYEPVTIALKPVDNPQAVGLIPREIYTRLVSTGGHYAETIVPLPETPGLTQIKEVVLTHEASGTGVPIDLEIERLEALPAAPPGE